MIEQLEAKVEEVRPKVIEAGDRVLELPSGAQLEAWALEGDKKRFGDTITYLFSFAQSAKGLCSSNFGRRFLEHHQEDISKDPSLLGIVAYIHDLNNELNLTGIANELAQGANSETLQGLDFNRRACDAYVTAVSMILSAAQLMTGDSKYKRYERFDRVKVTGGNKNAFVGKVGFMRSDMYFALIQLAQDALRYTKGEIKVGVSFSGQAYDYGSESACIEDLGKGIAKSRLKSIWHGDSTTGGGYGFQMVRKIGEIVGMNIHIDSKTPSAGHAWQYSVSDDKLTKSKRAIQGTKTTLTISHTT